MVVLVGLVLLLLLLGTTAGEPSLSRTHAPAWRCPLRRTAAHPGSAAARPQAIRRAQA